MNTGWKVSVSLKHLFTEKEDYALIQESMNLVADAIDQEPAFRGFDTRDFRAIPKGDKIFGPLDYADRLLARMYDHADARRIWIA